MATDVICPTCGGSQWVADYQAAVVQPVSKLVRLDDGSYEADYTEPGRIVEEGPTEDWRCLGCGFKIEETL